MTLIWVYNAAGKLKWRCGRKCRDGRTEAGRCICDDRCRNQSLAHALIAVRQDLRLIKKRARKRWRKGTTVAINAEVWQSSLPFPELAQGGAIDQEGAARG